MIIMIIIIILQLWVVTKKYMINILIYYITTSKPLKTEHVRRLKTDLVSVPYSPDMNLIPLKSTRDTIE